MNSLFRWISLVALLLLTVQCQNPKRQPADGATGNDTLVHHADLLSIIRHDTYTDVTTTNPWDTTRVLHRYLLVPREAPLPGSLPQGTVVRTPLEKSLVYSSVHASALDILGAIDRIGGVCDLAYIKTPALLERAQAGRLVDAGNSMSPDIERVMELSPDAILLSPFENAGYGRIGKMGIPIIECADYLETSPLGRAEWIKLLGLLYGKEAEADSLFAQIEQRYNQLKELVEHTGSAPMVISELKSGSAWYMPGGKSYMARLFADAGGSYPWSDNGESGSIPLAFETVFNRAGEADIWLIKSFNAGQLSYKALQKEYAPYARFKAFREHNIYGCNTAACNYYEETPFRPDLLLQELAALFHPDRFPDYQLRYFQPLSE
ncbi:MAG TPA: ABC transporter substrate-binding protein [Candidatus Barnesiella excrementavium]|nr:ABC transporter substrate-binding protein [Candidatus Barnesiella excrementavium]